MIRLLKLFALHVCLMFVIVLMIGIQHGGLTQLYGDSWLIIVILISIFGGLATGRLMLRIIVQRDLQFTRRELMNYSALYFVLVGGFVQIMMLLEKLVGSGNQLRYASAIFVLILWTVGRQMAIYLLPPDKWKLSAKDDEDMA